MTEHASAAPTGPGPEPVAESALEAALASGAAGAAEGGAPPAPRRRRLSPAERLPLLRDAALEEFAERGYAAASMEAVARRAGVAKGLLYHYFPGGKADLFASVVRGMVQRPIAEAERRVAEGGSSAGTLRALLVQAMALAGDPRWGVLDRLMIAEGDRFPELADLYHDAVVRRAETLIGGVLREGVARGEFRPEILSWPPQLLLAPAALLSVWTLTFGNRHALDAEALRDGHLDLLLNGLLASPPVPP